MGGRRLRWWLNYPLVDTEKIKERLLAVSEIKEGHHEREALRTLLSDVYDIERLGSKISIGIANARDLVSLKNSLLMVPAIQEEISHMESAVISEIYSSLDNMPDVVDLIDRAIKEDPPMTVREGNIIREGFDGELDELILASTDGKRWIASLETQERKKTGINTLKVGFNNVFGYYIEVTKANAHMVPDDYVRKQTLVNAERYINEDLKKYESVVLNAEEKRKNREYELFAAVREKVGREIKRIQWTASNIAELDALVSLAEVAERNNYCCPKITDEDGIDIRDGRHPVVEQMNRGDVFVPNDTTLDCGNNRLLIITGPNMAGKSTYIRQVAIIVLMAQMGSFVPASKAEIGVVDRIFTRVGASDSLTRGQSTFMVEMTEVATILENATPKSLILLDEVGRGTSTFDGLSIAWAVAEYIHDSEDLGARTLFATHYHELTDLGRTREGVKNYSVAVKEWGEDIIFLRKIIEGGTNRSYGIQVARLAGVPEHVIARAKEVLKNLERGELDEMGVPRIARGRKSKKGTGMTQLSLFVEEDNHILRELKSIDPYNITPMDALNKITEWKKRIRG
jgi:DNA mismatch repair protein MutS